MNSARGDERQSTGQSETPASIAKKLEDKRREEDARLDQRLRDEWNTGPENYSAEDWRSMREHLRLPLLYPGKFVAYRSTYEGKGDKQRLVRREVIDASDTLEGLHELLSRFPQEEYEPLGVVYIDDPGDLPML